MVYYFDGIEKKNSTLIAFSSGLNILSSFTTRTPLAVIKTLYITFSFHFILSFLLFIQ